MPEPFDCFFRFPPSFVATCIFAGFFFRFQLVLDLDETLVHSSFKPVAGADFIMDIMVDGTFYKVSGCQSLDGINERRRHAAVGGAVCGAV